MKTQLLTLFTVATLSFGLSTQTCRAVAGCGNGGSEGTSPPCPAGQPTPCPPPPNQPCGSPLHAYTGNGHYAIEDLRLFAGVGEHTLAWMRYSNTRYTNASASFGNASNNRHSYQWEMVDAGVNSTGQAQLDLFHPDGIVNRFTQVSPTQWNSAPDVPDVINQNGDVFSLKTSSGWRYNFARLNDGSGYYYQLQSFVDPGQVTYTLLYDSSRRLQQVSDPAGRSISITCQSLPITNVNFATLATITTTPPAGTWQEIVIANPQPFRYVRYRGADNSRSMVGRSRVL